MVFEVLPGRVDVEHGDGGVAHVPDCRAVTDDAALNCPPARQRVRRLRVPVVGVRWVAQIDLIRQLDVLVVAFDGHVAVGERGVDGPGFELADQRRFGVDLVSVEDSVDEIRRAS